MIAGMVGAVVVALGVTALVVRWARETWQLPSGPVSWRRFDEEFEIGKGLLVDVGELSVRLDRLRGEDGALRLEVALQLGAESRRFPLDALPQRISRYEVRRISSSLRRARLLVHEIPCRDEDYKAGRDCTPIRPAGLHFLGILLGGPARVSWQAEAARDWPDRPPAHVARYPRVNVAGMYMFATAELQRLGLDGESAEPALVLTNTRSAKVERVSLRRARADHQYQVDGLNIDWIFPARPPMETPIDPSHASGSSFLIDIGLYLPKPDVETLWTVCAECGPYQSNEVRISVTP